MTTAQRSLRRAAQVAVWVMAITSLYWSAAYLISPIVAPDWVSPAWGLVAMIMAVVMTTIAWKMHRFDEDTQRAWRDPPHSASAGRLEKAGDEGIASGDLTRDLDVPHDTLSNHL